MYSINAGGRAAPRSLELGRTLFNEGGKPFALIIILDWMLYVEVSAKTAVVFERLLKGWTAETMPTLYRSNLRTFLVLKGEVKEVTLTRIKTILK